MAYIGVAKENLPVYGIPKAKQLGDFTTTEADVKRNVSRMPLVLSRLYEEDIKFTKSSTDDKKKFRMSPKSQD